MGSSANLAHINPEIVAWALKRRGVTPEEIATKQLTAEQIKAWRDRRALPTHPQAEALAEKLRIPFLVFFLSEVPDIELEIPDLRTVSGQPEDTPPSSEFMQVINDALVRQDWYRDSEANRDAAPLSFVGRFANRRIVREVADDIAGALAIAELRPQVHSWKEFLDQLITRCEELGVLVFRSAVVGHATNRRLLVKEFRGFVLSDVLAPIVFINDDDAKAAQTFTLIHELAHIWIGATGISDPNIKRRAADLPNPIERFCNAVAAEALVPMADFLAAWNDSIPLSANVAALSIRYRVSSLVLLIRARDAGKISQFTLDREFDDAWARFREQDKRELAKLLGKEKKARGGNFWASFLIRNSKKFTDLVVASAVVGRTRFTDAASLLGVKAATFERYIQNEQG